jgi:predicted negative regulator of RcsB-dependent stress response
MTKDELRDDPVMERIQGMLRFAERNSRWLIAGVVVIAAVVVGLLALRSAQARAERDAALALSEAQSSVMQANWAAAENQLRQVVDNFGRTAAAPMARVQLGDVLREQGRSEEALSLYGRAAEAGGAPELIRAAGQRGRAAALEELGRFAEASEAYEQAARVAPFLRADDWINAARTALRAGEPARAKSMIEEARDVASDEQRGDVMHYLAEAEAALP